MPKPTMKLKNSIAIAALMAASIASATPYSFRVASPGLKPNNTAMWQVTGSPTTAFASAYVGSAATPDLIIPLKNIGGIGSLGTIAFTGANAADFSQSSNCTGITQNSPCAITVRFTPLSTGSRTAVLTVGGTTQTFTGTGVAVPVGPFNFTTCGMSGNTGPTSCTASYSGTSLANLVSVSAGVQTWAVPSTGTYTIVLAGAGGGSGSTYPNTSGAGAVITTQLSLTQGALLKILVGQAGTGGAYLGGGGGATYLALGSTPLAVAGGGGGSGGAWTGPAANASINTSLTAINLNYPSYGYSTGAGFNANGSSVVGSSGASYACYGVANSFVNGGTAPALYDSWDNSTASGGFGGGGNGCIPAGGGGGGYSPGAIGASGGGNSYSTATINGASATNFGQGYITFTKN